MQTLECPECSNQIYRFKRPVAELLQDTFARAIDFESLNPELYGDPQYGSYSRCPICKGDLVFKRHFIIDDDGRRYCNGVHCGHHTNQDIT